jgi:hypothetical protein
MPPLQAVTRELRLPQGAEARGNDWHLPARRDPPGRRWSGPNPRPRLLLPVTAAAPVEIALTVLDHVPRYFDRLSVRLNDAPVAWTLREREGQRHLVIEGMLRADAPSVLELDGPSASLASFGPRNETRRVGICLGETVLRPLA